MLRIHTIESPEAANDYYISQQRSDYYAGAKDKPGLWFGKGAARLGLKGAVKGKQFEALCHNKKPTSKKPLTKRQNANRRVAYDFNWHPPKSVSVMYGLTGDNKIKLALERAIRETMEDIEREIQTRVRKNGSDTNRPTGNMACGQFTHEYGRPTEDDNGKIIPDPHLHGHSVVFNATFDQEEGCWKAAQIGDLKRDAPYFEACFHSRLIQHMQALGYDIQQKGRDWEIAGISPDVIKKFSNRSEDVAQARRDEELLSGKKLTKKQVAELGKRTRKIKSAGDKLSASELRQAWMNRLSKEERNSIFSCFHTAQLKRGLHGQIGINSTSLDLAKDGVGFAIKHCFETQSVMDRRRLLTEAIRASYGKAGHEAVEQVFESSNVLNYEEDGRTWCTTNAVRDEEKRFIAFSRNGRGSHKPFVGKLSPKYGMALSDQQRLAMKHILESHDRVIGLRGKAGTGKTTMMKMTVGALEQKGNLVQTLAPTSGAVDVLKEEGFKTASTIQSFLLSDKAQRALAGGVLWIDEAGLLSSRQMAKLADVAERNDCRIILSGDKGQHSGVERGDALRILESHGGLIPAQLDQIFRQKDPVYRGAVKNLAEGNVDKAFSKLGYLGSLKQVSDQLRPVRLAMDYVKSVKEGNTALVVSPTHRESEEVTRYIRRQLFKSGDLIPLNEDCRQLKSKRLSTAQKSQHHNYEEGLVIETHGPINRAIPSGSRCKVLDVNEQGVWVSSKGRRVLLDLTKADKFDVFGASMLYYYPGDRIRITRNGKSLEGKKLTNNSIEQIDSFKPNGDIVLKGGKTLPSDYGHFTPGYCVTSHSSQGRTVDKVFIAESSMSFPAASLEQFYVSCSRGRNKVKIYTDSIQDLKQAISRSCARKSAHDYDWDAQVKLRSQNPSKIQKVSRHSHQWLDNFAEPLAAPTKRAAPESPRPEPTPSVAPSLSSEINQKPPIDIDL